MSAKVRSCKSWQQNEEDGVRHIGAVLVVPTWLSGGRVLPVFRSRREVRHPDRVKVQ